MKSQMKQPVAIRSRDYWIKVLEMLQQNWAIVDIPTNATDGPCEVFFIDDNSCVFDKLKFDRVEDAKAGLKRNGFSRYEPDANMLKHIPPPPGPFYTSPDCKTLVYSSGAYWH